MERAAAIKKLGKLLGKNLGYRVNAHAPTREERAAAREALKPAVADWKRLGEEKEKRCQAILAADVEYQNLKAAYEASRKHKDQLSSVNLHYKITVGISNSIFFHIKAEGDSWEEVIDKLTQEKVA